MGYGPDEFDALPWWQRRMFIERLDEYLRVQAGEEPDDDTPEDMKLAGLGFQVQQAPVPA